MLFRSALALAEVPLDRSFLEAVTVPDTITDPDERDKEFKALARRLTNKLGGTIRRYRKIAGNELHNFALRTVNDPGDEAEGHLGVGVRVWRVEDSKPEDKTPSTPPAPPAPPAPQA